MFIYSITLQPLSHLNFPTHFGFFSVFVILLLLPCLLGVFRLPRVRRRWSTVLGFRILRRVEPHTCHSAQRCLQKSLFRSLRIWPFRVHVSKLVLVSFRLCLLRIRFLLSFGRPSIPSRDHRRLRILLCLFSPVNSLLFLILRFKNEFLPYGKSI